MVTTQQKAVAFGRVEGFNWLTYTINPDHAFHGLPAREDYNPAR